MCGFHEALSLYVHQTTPYNRKMGNIIGIHTPQSPLDTRKLYCFAGTCHFLVAFPWARCVLLEQMTSPCGVSVNQYAIIFGIYIGTLFVKTATPENDLQQCSARIARPAACFSGWKHGIIPEDAKLP